MATERRQKRTRPERGRRLEALAYIALIATAIYSVTIDGDATAAVVLIPIGLIALFNDRTATEVTENDE